jgi:MinD superfamily P-loop ATPase
MTKTLVIISGKGGTGKTSLTASFALLAKDAVLADCDVDAADLHLLLEPDVREEHKFVSGETASIDPVKCVSCGKCAEACAFSAIDDSYTVDPVACEGCAVCTLVCPAKAVTMSPAECGSWFISKTRAGWMAHAKLTPGKENSGRLVSLVRMKAAELAETEGSECVIVDGPPGVGCPVIASIGNTDLALIVTEPGLSGLHDLKRAAKTAAHFRVEAAVAINKSDINEEISDEIENFCRENGLLMAGRIPYSTDFVKAQLAGRSIIEYGDGAAAASVKTVYERVMDHLFNA